MSAERISEADLTRISDYIDGRLDANESLELENRLEAEPELGRAFDEIMQASDAVVRHGPPPEHLSPEVETETARDDRALPRSLWAMGIVSLAAAILIAVVLLRDTGPSTVEFEMAALPGGVDSQTHHELGRLPDSEERSVHRGPEEEQPTWTAQQYVERARDADRSRAEALFESASTSTEAGYFYVPFRADEPVSALMILVTPRSGTSGSGREIPGSVELRFPRNAAEREIRFAAGEVHLLPNESFAIDPDIDPKSQDPVRFDRGILVPRGISESMRVVLALSRDLLDATKLEALADEIAAANRSLGSGASTPGGVTEALTAALEKQAMTVRVILVDEP